MQRKTLIYLEDISMACENINLFSSGKVYLDYKKDYQLKCAIERLLITIGEATNKLSQLCSIHLTSESAIVALRNRIVHEYQKLEDKHIW